MLQYLQLHELKELMIFFLEKTNVLKNEYDLSSVLQQHSVILRQKSLTVYWTLKVFCLFIGSSSEQKNINAGVVMINH